MTVNNEIYHHYGNRWYEAKDDPVALLRAESKLKNPWIKGILQKKVMPFFSSEPAHILDVGCGAGFLTNFLIAELDSDHVKVTGLDIAQDSLDVARAYDSTQKVTYIQGDATRLPFPDSHFAAVTCMDFLEHVENPHQVIQECSRVLKPGAPFFFHTFSRTFLSHLIVIKGVEWFVKNTPEKMHLHRLFINPNELQKMCENSKMKIESIQGIRPRFNRAFFELLFTREVSDRFEFQFRKSLSTGYIGYARKLNS